MACATRIVLQRYSVIDKLFNDRLLFSLSFLFKLLLFILGYLFVAVLRSILKYYKITCDIANSGGHNDKLTKILIIF